MTAWDIIACCYVGVAYLGWYLLGPLIVGMLGDTFNGDERFGFTVVGVFAPFVIPFAAVFALIYVLYTGWYESYFVGLATSGKAWRERPRLKPRAGQTDEEFIEEIETFLANRKQAED